MALRFFYSIFICIFLINLPFTIFAESTLPRAPYILSQEIREWEKEGREFFFVDVREPSEYESGYLPGAVNIPYYEMEERKDELPTDKPVVIYCTYSSWRAPYAGNLLADAGFKNVYVLEGGASGWNAGGQVIYAVSGKPAIVPKPKDLKKEFGHPPVREYQTRIDLTREQLAEFDGQDGRPAYVAVDGVIYDVTVSRLWRGGAHDPSHGEVFAGRDLTELLHTKAPHGTEHLEGFPVVGNLLP